MEITQLIDGVDFGEGPRWRDGLLWYSDFYQGRVYTVTAEGERSVVVELDDQPSGLGWLPDGRLLVVAMTAQRLLVVDGTEVAVHAELGELAGGLCNDMVVDEGGTAWVGNFGFDFQGGDELAPTRMIRVRPDGSAAPVGDDLLFPNGAVITPDGNTLIVGETFGARYSAFEIGADGELGSRRTWAEVPGSAPDGCTLDAEGAIWFADAANSRLVRVAEGGEVLAEVETPEQCFCCMLGGPDLKTLYFMTAPGSHPDDVAGRAGGAIWSLEAPAPRSGRP